MRKITQFQSTTAYVYALTEDGILWRRTHKGDEWTAIRGPGDQNPFKAVDTPERVAQRLRDKLQGNI
jgi:hypothetical protein